MNTAYIDPNTGGMLFQILAASFALFSGLILLFARQIRAGFARVKRWVRERLGKEDAPGESVSVEGSVSASSENSKTG